MVVQIELPDLKAPARIAFEHGKRFDVTSYWAFCAVNPNLRSQLNADGEIVIVPPAGGESSYQSSSIARQLGNWAERDGRGKVFDSGCGFVLKSGAVYSPDAAWLSNARLAKLSKAERRRFLPVAPEFVIEVMSPNDRLSAAKAKMLEWIGGGVELGWLIVPDRRRLLIYRQGIEPQILEGAATVAADGAVSGFVADLAQIWEGLW